MVTSRWVVRCHECDFRAEAPNRSLAEGFGEVHESASRHETTLEQVDTDTS
jgi:hypothetical protein